MKKNFSPPLRQPSIVKYSQPEHTGTRSLTLKRHAIGFVLKGRKLIYHGDQAHEVSHGDLFYLATGHHYVEDIPENNRPFEQIIFYFNPEQMSTYLNMLSMKFGMVISDHHQCENCLGQNQVIYPAWKAMKSFFSSLNQYIKDGLLSDDSAAESIKMLELIYLIASNPHCCLQNKILEHSDIEKESFEQVVQNNVFTDISIEELAQLTNRSLTSFKKEFKRLFFESPHQWMIKQRLMHARLLLISSGKPVAEVGSECNFPNTSHFIKLFKKEFGYTPSVYRNRHMDRNGSGTKTVKREKQKTTN